MSQAPNVSSQTPNVSSQPPDCVVLSLSAVVLVDVQAPLDPFKIDKPAYPRAEPSLAVTDLDIGESAVIYGIVFVRVFHAIASPLMKCICLHVTSAIIKRTFALSPHPPGMLQLSLLICPLSMLCPNSSAPDLQPKLPHQTAKSLTVEIYGDACLELCLERLKGHWCCWRSWQRLRGSIGNRRWVQS